MTSAAQNPMEWPSDVRTLAIDVGGSGLKAGLLDAAGAMVTERVRVPTPYPCSPQRLVAALVELTAPLPTPHRVTVGFPGLVRHGRVLNAPNLVRTKPGGPVDPKMAKAWHGHDLATSLAEAFDLPVKVANDADVQGCAVVRGEGVEFVMTLGTGVGTALFDNGRLLPHLELSHSPFRKGQDYDEQIGEAARQQISPKRWNERVRLAIETFDAFLFFDTVYVGGGNAKRIIGDLGPRAVIVPNAAGILGGIRIWELDT